MKRAQVVLNELVHHYDVDHALTQFLRTRAGHLLSAPTGNTGIPFSYFNSDNLQALGMDLESTFVPSQFSRDSGVYYFISDNSKHSYCGSATDFTSRMGNHYDSILNNPVTNQQVVMANLGIDRFKFLEVAKTPNYHLEFILQHPDVMNSDLNVMTRILQLFTQYEARALEQAIIHATQPNLNGPQDVLFTTKWSLADFQLDDRSQPITAIGKDSGNV
jgi:hypothetical protein